MGCNYYLKKSNGDKWLIPVSDVGKRLELLISDVVLTEKVDVNEGLTIDLTKCLEEVEELHIGKSSVGWYFNLCIYPTLNIYNLKDWVNMFDSDEYYIQDEYDDKITKDEMMECITQRKAIDFDNFNSLEEFEQDALKSINVVNQKMFHPHKTYNTYDEFLLDNSACRGKYGLMRHLSTIWDVRGDERWNGFLPMFNTFYIDKDSDETYDLTTSWDFS